MTETTPDLSAAPVVWISRPAARAAPLAAALAACGLRPLLRPAMVIEETSDAAEAAARLTARAAQFDLAVFVSQEAAARLANYATTTDNNTTSPKLPALALGAATAAALPPRYVLARPAAATGDTAQLLADDARALFAACRRIAIVGGTDQQNTPPAAALGAALRARGIAVENIVLYRRLPAPPDAALATQGAAGGIQAATAFSGDSAKFMLAMTAPDNHWLRRLPLFVIHANIAAAARRMGYAPPIVTTPQHLPQTIQTTLANNQNPRHSPHPLTHATSSATPQPRPPTPLSTATVIC